MLYTDRNRNFSERDSGQEWEWEDDGGLDFVVGIERSEMASQIIIRDLQGELVEVIEEMDQFRALVNKHDPIGDVGAFSMNGTMSYPENHSDDEKVIALAKRMKAAFVIYHDKHGSHWSEDMRNRV